VLRRVFARLAAAEHAECCPSNPARAEQQAAERELDQRLALLEFSYKEVLDATKHQDDKINRLLTTVAFLTAAALALAGLQGGRPLAATFRVDGRYTLPLALIGLGGFLAGVTVTVIMLLASTTTPLTLPGRTNSVTPNIRYVPGPRKSQSYFNEISETALPGWHYKWRAKVSDPSPDVATLRREHNDSLVRETHNLAVRTQYKYQRSNEAVAVLAFALLSFVLAAILILVAASRQPPNPASGTLPPPLTLNLTVRAILAGIFFGYCVLQLLATQRDKPPTVIERAYPARRFGVPVPFWRGCYVLVGSLIVPELLLLPSESAPWRMVLALATPGLAWLVLGLALPRYSESEEADQRTAAQAVMDPQIALPAKASAEDQRKRNAAVRKAWLAALVIAGCYAALGAVAAGSTGHRELLGLIGAYAAGLLFAASAIWQLTRKNRRLVKEFRQTVIEAQAPPAAKS